MDLAESTSHAALFIPGISGEPFCERYKTLARACVDSNITLLRYESWTRENIQDKTIRHLLDEIAQLMRELRANHTTVSIIGKSIGGGLALLYKHADRMVLWAPALTMSSTIALPLDTPLKELTLDDIHVNANYLADITCPVTIIHGNNDETISLENSRRITETLPNAKLIVINGANHHYTDHMEDIIGKTTHALKE